MFIAVISLVLCTGISIASSQQCNQEAFDFQEKLSPTFDIEWKVVGDSITFKITATTTNWVAIGFHPMAKPTGMRGADIIMAGVSSNGACYAHDTTAVDNFRPYKDRVQNVQIVCCSEQNGVTTFIFTRKLKGNVNIMEGNIGICWAIGTNDAEILGNSRYHGPNKGWVTTILLRSKRTAPPPRVIMPTNLPAPVNPNRQQQPKPVLVPVNRPTRNQQTMNQQTMNQQTMNQQTMNQQTMYQQTMYQQTMYLDSDETVMMKWMVKDGNITAEISGPTLGWIGVGFSPTTNMAGADLIMGGVGSNGEKYLHDLYSMSNGLPTIDDLQNVSLLDASQKEGQTMIKFERALKTGDRTRDRELKVGEMTNVLWAIGSRDIMSGMIDYSLYHAKRGFKTFAL